MNPRERILTAINHREPDHVPVDLGSNPSSGISAIAYNNVKQFLGITGGHTRIYDVVQQLAQPEDWMLDRFNVDVVDIGRAFNTEGKDWYDIKVMDGNTAQYPAWFHPEQKDDGSWVAHSKDGQAIACMPEGGAFYDQIYFPYQDDYPGDYSKLSQAMEKVLWAALVHSPWDHANDKNFWDVIRQKALELKATSGKALMIVCGCNLFEWGTFLRRMDNFLMDLLADPVNVKKLLDALMEHHLATLEKVCKSVGDVADILRFGDDLGMDSGPFMSLNTYRELFKPRHTMLCDYVKKHSNMKTFLHSCGSIYSLLPDLIEAGYDIINPVQTNAVNMEPERLKKEFGKDITFWGGGADTRHVLNRGTVEEVKTHVKQRLEILMPGGGFVFNPIHNLLPEVPPENIVAMFDTVREFGTY